MTKHLLLALLGAALALVSTPGCAGGPSPKQQAEISRSAMPKCEAGDQDACHRACVNGGPNESCHRACKASHGDACSMLGSRLEREQDADDADSPIRKIGPQDPDEITNLYERACTLGHGGSCVLAGGRIMNGQGRGNRSPAVAVTLLKRGCEKHRDADACCAMANLNRKLAQGKNANSITDFAEEAKRWAKLSERAGKECPELPPEDAPK